MATQKLTVHMHQDASDKLNITLPQNVKNLVTFPPNVRYAKANILLLATLLTESKSVKCITTVKYIVNSCYTITLLLVLKVLSNVFILY